MRVSATTALPRLEQNQYSYVKKIKSYGQNNDYPQKILDIVDSSGTGKVCFDIYSKFIEGGGFTDPNLGLSLLNEREEGNSLLRKCSKDLRKFNGFAMLIKYNALAEPFSFYNIPFEHCRLEIDRNREYTGRIAVHPDWTGKKGLPFRLSDIKYIDHYNPEKVPEQLTKYGPLEYLGQVIYLTSDGDFEYPICPFDAVVTDMLTEESVSTVKHRNAKFNFLPSGILVRKGIKPDTGLTDDNGESLTTSADEIKKMQGDANTSKIWVVDVDADEEKPEFIPFDAKNYDKAYEYTENTVQENIARMSMIPPILRGVDVGAGFGADLMNNAYSFMNSITDNERRTIETVFRKMLGQRFADYTIKPLKYNLI